MDRYRYLPVFGCFLEGTNSCGSGRSVGTRGANVSRMDGAAL